jgi:hypothetical protein
MALSRVIPASEGMMVMDCSLVFGGVAVFEDGSVTGGAASVSATEGVLVDGDVSMVDGASVPVVV